MNRKRGYFLLSLFVSSPLLAATTFVPVVSVPAGLVSSPQGGVVSVEWTSTITAFNPTDRTKTLRFARIIGRGAHLEASCANVMDLPPGQVRSFSTIDRIPCATSGSSSPAFVEIEHDSGLILTARIDETAFRDCLVSPTPSLPISIASAPLPVFREPFAARASVVSSEIAPSPPTVDDAPCRYPDYPRSRRVNVTLLNPAAVSSTVTVSAAGSSLPPITVTLPAGAVEQVNDLFPGEDFRLLLVSASEPVLCYASSVMAFTDPGQAPSIGVYSFTPLE